MLKGEKYIACSLLVFGALLFALGYIGLPWWLCIIVALVPAVFFVVKAVRWTDKFSDKVARKTLKKIK